MILDKIIFVSICLVSGSVVFLIGLIYGYISECNKWKKECIERGFACYHPKTGKWEWNKENEND